MKLYAYKDRFNKYNVIVTGAANGIGQTCAIRFALEGANVYACDIDGEGLDRTKEGAAKGKGTVECRVFDISDKQAVDDAVNSIIAGAKKIHVLVNSAGIAGERTFTEISQEEWLRYMNINLNGIFYVTQPVVRNMIEHKFGKVINISSKSGLIGRANRVPYSSSKFGLNGLTQALALEVAQYGINVNAVCPSRIETQMTTGIFRDRARMTNKTLEEITDAYIKSVPIGRLGLPEDVAAMVAFLATEEASYITGQFISVSGGR